MEVNTYQYCILIASHISKEQRISYLIECLESLIQQDIIIPIYLSISFENINLQEITLNTINKSFDSPYLNIVIQNQKTSQMKHFYQLLLDIKDKHNWIMFCDDDDTYKKNRTKQIITYIASCLQNNDIIGLYESTFNKNHKEQRHEYWMYCVHVTLFIKFYNIVSKHPIIMNDKCCDVLFAEYLRRLNSDKIFIQMKESYYNYRTENNNDSVTGIIQNNKVYYTNKTKPPNKKSKEFIDYVLNFNQYFQNNIRIYLHDTYLRTIVGCSYDKILKMELLNNYDILEYIDINNINKLKNLHEYLLEICKELYEIQI
jgi:hypothetical protein